MVRFRMPRVANMILRLIAMRDYVGISIWPGHCNMRCPARLFPCRCVLIRSEDAVKGVLQQPVILRVTT
jgi:hypothetical protein